MRLPEAPDNSNPLRGQGVNRHFYLPRLPRDYYQGDAVVHWTLPHCDARDRLAQ